ncbi:xylulokinase/erythritol kinase [Haloactinospora alba]|uniref:Xylulokinase/erythritol kinase n=1 Tax=Haloactinospora alba TaxID=405555 RepID=A0A543NNQ9_9ACTN|nr:FGGY-family carbohydrate kinase [Haloactinospora alba]TQN33478.1 xylulokinase/erythritol kinase [Haloactinospora alba]
MIIGVDVGTTVTKAAVFDRDGRALAEADEPTTLHRPGGARVEQDLDEVLATVSSVVRRVAATQAEPVTAVALTGQGDGLWLRDADGRPSRRAISWLDGRAGPLVRQWYEDGTMARVHKTTGQGMFPGAHGPLLAALDREEPETLRRSAVAGYCVDAIVQRLTGEVTVDASDASLPFLDVRDRTYSTDALAECGVSRWRGLLPEPAAPNSLFSLGREGARLLDLPEGTPVTGGPFDLPSCLLGSGLTEVGDGLLTVGTTLACQVVADEVRVDSSGEPAGMWLCTDLPDRFSRAMPAMVGTASLDWLLDLLGIGIGEVEPLLEASPPGARGVSALPFLSESGERAPFVDPRARGQLTGVSLGTERADIVRAVCESIAYAARHCLETAGLTGRLAACGGGSRSRAWMQVFADVLGRPVVLPSDDAMGVRGATAAAWRALGDPVDTSRWLGQGTRVNPRPHLRDQYEEGYARYRAQLDSARALWSSDAPA